MFLVYFLYMYIHVSEYMYIVCIMNVHVSTSISLVNIIMHFRVIRMLVYKCMSVSVVSKHFA